MSSMGEQITGIYFHSFFLFLVLYSASNLKLIFKTTYCPLSINVH